MVMVIMAVMVKWPRVEVMIVFMLMTLVAVMERGKLIVRVKQMMMLKMMKVIMTKLIVMMMQMVVVVIARFTYCDDDDGDGGGGNSKDVGDEDGIFEN